MRPRCCIGSCSFFDADTAVGEFCSEHRAMLAPPLHVCLFQTVVEWRQGIRHDHRVWDAVRLRCLTCPETIVLGHPAT